MSSPSSIGPSWDPFNGRPHRFKTIGYSGGTVMNEKKMKIKKKIKGKYLLMVYYNIIIGVSYNFTSWLIYSQRRSMRNNTGYERWTMNKFLINFILAQQ